MPAVIVMADRGANRCDGAGSGLGCYAMTRSGLGTGKGSCQQWLGRTGAAVAEAAVAQSGLDIGAGAVTQARRQRHR